MSEPMRSYTRPRAATNRERADTQTPLGETPNTELFEEPPPKPVGTLSTQIEYRGRSLTITATGMMLDAFYEGLTTDDDVSDTRYTISSGTQYRDQFLVIEFTNMTIDQYCDLLDKRLGVPS